MDIDLVIQKYNLVNIERTELNNQIRQYYIPLIQEAAKENDFAKIEMLLSEIPDCPFYLTALRMEEMYKQNQLEK